MENCWAEQILNSLEKIAANEYSHGSLHVFQRWTVMRRSRQLESDDQKYFVLISVAAVVVMDHVMQYACK